MPHHLSDYLHRAGRVSRGGTPGRITALHKKRDTPLLQQILTATATATPVPPQPPSSSAFPQEQPQQTQLQMHQMPRAHAHHDNQPLPALGNISFVSNSRTKRILRLQRRWQQLLDMKMKAEKKLADLKKHGVLRKSHKLPRRPDSVVERSEAQQTAKLIRGADGHMQLLAVRRSRRKQEEIRMQSMAGRYEDASVTQPIPGVPTFSETHKVRDRRPLF
ncbi:uncharacterized protein LOC34619450 [Cyclospora cayetanensis]|uniref:Uncharacterized protein LOC34619450 n=1 Tax=Cyclospora cayetanensis TaxID=88456 RepID=A0A6P6RT10_9EIME|nr:uncharacterized protein LOC34619450 [Cyclospora cayetanensis]